MFIIEHLNRFVLLFVLESQRYCFIRFGQKTGNSLDRLHYCKQDSCKVVQLPSDTSYFLRARDIKVSKIFKMLIRSHRDVLSKNCNMD